MLVLLLTYRVQLLRETKKKLSTPRVWSHQPNAWTWLSTIIRSTVIGLKLKGALPPMQRRWKVETWLGSAQDKYILDQQPFGKVEVASKPGRNSLQGLERSILDLSKHRGQLEPTCCAAECVMAYYVMTCGVFRSSYRICWMCYVILLVRDRDRGIHLGHKRGTFHFQYEYVIA